MSETEGLQTFTESKDVFTSVLRLRLQALLNESDPALLSGLESLSAFIVQSAKG